MSQAHAAAGMDRLPWLEDEPAPPRRREGNRELAGWAVAATLLVAGTSYWMGANSWEQPAAPGQAPAPTATVPLPQPREIEPVQPQVIIDPQPEVAPAPQLQVPITRPNIDERSARPRAGPSPYRATSRPSAPVAHAPEPASTAVKEPVTTAPALQAVGAYGRLVRIGAFGSRHQAKLGWWYMVRAYPAVAHLQAKVVEARNSRGRRFYRFEIGTTSQAHSEVLCQRMQRIRLSCAVIGLPWKPKGVER